MKQWDCQSINTSRPIRKYMGCIHTHIHPKELLSLRNTLKEASHFTFKNKVFFPRERHREREREKGGRQFIFFSSTSSTILGY